MAEGRPRIEPKLEEAIALLRDVMERDTISPYALRCAAVSVVVEADERELCRSCMTLRLDRLPELATQNRDGGDGSDWPVCDGCAECWDANRAAQVQWDTER